MILYIFLMFGPVFFFSLNRYLFKSFFFPFFFVPLAYRGCGGCKFIYVRILYYVHENEWVERERRMYRADSQYKNSNRVFLSGKC